MRRWLNIGTWLAIVVWLAFVLLSDSFAQRGGLGTGTGTGTGAGSGHTGSSPVPSADAIQQETGDYLLLESGSFILKE
jgi:hypothetical protein